MVVESLFSVSAVTGLPAAVRVRMIPLSTTLMVSVSDSDSPATVAVPVIFTVSALASVVPSSRAVSWNVPVCLCCPAGMLIVNELPVWSVQTSS